MFAQLRPGSWAGWCRSAGAAGRNPPALILVLLIFAKLQCVRIFSVGGGGGGGEGWGTVGAA